MHPAGLAALAVAAAALVRRLRPRWRVSRPPSRTPWPGPCRGHWQGSGPWTACARRRRRRGFALGAALLPALLGAAVATTVSTFGLP